MSIVSMVLFETKRFVETMSGKYDDEARMSFVVPEDFEALKAKCKSESEPNREVIAVYSENGKHFPIHDIEEYRSFLSKSRE